MFFIQKMTFDRSLKIWEYDMFWNWNVCFWLYIHRVHCFHYLIPLAKQGNYAIVANVESMDYDPLIVRLNKDISGIEEAMGASLQQHKFQYIFEGMISHYLLF